MNKIVFLIMILFFVGCSDDCGCVTPPKTVEVQGVFVVIEDNQERNILDYLKANDLLFDNLKLWFFSNEYISSNVLKDESDFDSYIIFNNRFGYYDNTYIELPLDGNLDYQNVSKSKYRIDYNKLYSNDTIEVYYKPINNWKQKIDKIYLNGELQTLDSVLIHSDLFYKTLKIVK